MSKLRKIYKNTVQPTIQKKINEQKPMLAQKAGSFLLDKAVGSPYVNIVVGAAKQIKQKYLPKVGTYAAKKFIRSKYAIDKLNTIPLVIFSSILRSIIGFLIFNNLKTGDRHTDFGISVCLTVVTTISSPFFFAMASSQSIFFENYTNILIKDISRTEGYNYYTKRRILYKTIIMIFIIVVLNFVTITSFYIQEIIFHSLVSSWIVEIIERTYKWKHKIVQLHYGINCYYTTIYCLTEKNFLTIPLRKIKYCDTETDTVPCFIENYIRPIEAKIININDLKKEHEENKLKEKLRDLKIKNLLKEQIIIINGS